jgi:hypothetical protein
LPINKTEVVSWENEKMENEKRKIRSVVFMLN